MPEEGGAPSEGLPSAGVLMQLMYHVRPGQMSEKRTPSISSASAGVDVHSSEFR